MSLKGKTIAVTGAFGSLGAAVVKALLENGATVAAIDLADAPRDAKALGAAHLHGGIDLADAAATQAAFDTIAKAHGGLHGLVNIAGGFAWEKVQGGAIDTWDRMYQMNVRTAVAASQAAMPSAGPARHRLIGCDMLTWLNTACPASSICAATRLH